MEGLIEFIFGNIFIIAIVVGGIISWFSRVMGGDDERETTRMPSGPMQQPADTPPQKVESQPPRSSSGEDRLRDYYEKKKDTLAKAKNEQEIGGGSSYETPNQDIYTNPFEQEEQLQAERKKTQPVSPVSQLNIKDWDRKRLAEGVVMAEILGPPRAHKPHSSNPRKR
ncbi:hypothetical protein [Halobacillus salinus]|uniref:Uncharacterized protein n=1 Tax=Halobacillus salinus TaxID=192814 RepID=A0A4Z0H1I9_9BACI|nr:hypothetical protein [Halobacillus salinus]TGB04263.1 hypothetical protein E4663_04465 [Halobacillus salinus]